jgi:AraC family transcriptional regulator of adaptative response/methylated-DNA-[protein]-cysteine methyltransferase
MLHMNDETPRQATSRAGIDERWEAVKRRDRGADGRFYYAVKTTGVYCRPSCAARTPLRRNVEFHKTAADAERAGFRPCKRCNPTAPGIDEQHAARIAGACRLIDAAAALPSLDVLAREAGMSRFYFHRVFKRVTGLTPKAYVAALRAGRLRDALPSSESVTDAIYAAGFNSNSRFYAKSIDVLGMKPARFRAGGSGETIRFAIGECSLGSILVGATAKGVCTIALGDDPEKLLRELQDRFPRAQLVGADKDFERLVARVIAFVESPSSGLDLPLDVRGTVFQQRVWKALREIPIGTTVSYAQLAARVGAPQAVRAVAQACASNAIAIAIPCHRVIRNDGAISGYRWGIERKRALLDREKKS